MQASVAERFVFGSSLPRSWTALVGRILLSAIFILSGITKLMNPAGTAAYMTSAGIGHADVLVYVAGAAELLGGLSLVFGALARIGALGLSVLLVIISVTFHRFWAQSGAEAQNQMVHFLKNVAIIGGLLTVAAHGPGPHSLDHRLRRARRSSSRS